MYGVENRFKMQLLLGLKGSPLRHGIPAAKDHLSQLLRNQQTEEPGRGLRDKHARDT